AGVLTTVHLQLPFRNTKCEQDRDNVTVKHMIGAFIPQCDEEGHYRPLQCHPSTGYCWCVNSTGQKIEGTNTPPGTKTPNCEAPDHPKTKCEQERDNVTVKHMIGAFIPQCDEEGHYRPLQCHPSTGYCWCVNSTGQKIEGTNTPPGTKTPNCEAPGKTVAL
uniref:Thyroglobulin type-1 domain-containing protein n=1 Tax=Electrophorus electricus TaxID=8005 RepID=A0A4W4FAB7_ELEEL